MSQPSPSPTAMDFHSLLNRKLDKLVRPDLCFHGRSWSVFQVCGYAGLALASAMAMTLVVQQGLSPLIMAALIPSAMATFLAVAMVTKVIVGEERLIYYHHEIAVIAVAAVLLWGLGQPVLPYLDVTLLGVGAFLACGRVGCLMVGCCYGRPHAWGICYRDEHAAAGFAPHLVGVRLFPIQVVEVLWVVGVVMVGVTLVVSGQVPGEALAWYIIMYGFGRFCFEFVRGDPERPYRAGFSEAQWTSLLLMLIVIGAERGGILPFHAWHVAATAALVLIILAVAVRRRLQKASRHLLLHPHHIKEVAEAVRQVRRNDEVQDPPAIIYSSCTSLGVEISARKIVGGTRNMDHYVLSSRNGTMNRETASTVMELILQLNRAYGSAELVVGNQGIFHLMLHPR